MHKLQRGTVQEQQAWRKLPDITKQTARETVRNMDKKDRREFVKAFAAEHGCDLKTVTSYFANRPGRKHRDSAPSLPLRGAFDPFAAVEEAVAQIDREIEKAQNDAAAANERAHNLFERKKELLAKLMGKMPVRTGDPLGAYSAK